MNTFTHASIRGGYSSVASLSSDLGGDADQALPPFHPSRWSTLSCCSDFVFPGSVAIVSPDGVVLHNARASAAVEFGGAA